MGYKNTRGPPWTAAPALIKVDEIGQNQQKNYWQKLFKTGAIFWEKAQCVCTKRPFSLATPQLDEAMNQSVTPL